MAKGLGRLRDKVAIVTGGGTGIGGGISRVFGREGAAVLVADIDPMVGNQAVADIEAEGGRALFVKTDVASEADIIAMIDRAIEAFGEVDILVNNVGVGVGKTVEQSDAADWERLMGINARSVFFAIKHVVPRMRARGGGSIINVGSLFALRGVPNYAIYSATKGAIRQLTKSAALAHAGEGIRINAVHPGIINTPASASDPAAQAIASASLGPIGRWGQPEDIAYGCLYLASDESSFVTGADLSIDGGLSA